MFGTTPEIIRKTEIIKEKISGGDEKVAKIWDKAKSGKTSVKQAHLVATKKPVKKKKGTRSDITTLRKEKVQCREKLANIKAQIIFIRNKYDALIADLVSIIENSKNSEELDDGNKFDYVIENLERLISVKIAQKDRELYPTIKDLRKAELI